MYDRTIIVVYSDRPPLFIGDYLIGKQVRVRATTYNRSRLIRRVSVWVRAKPAI
jgi:hypothetical protein